MLAAYFEGLGYEAVVASDGPAALGAADQAPWDAAVIDIGLPGMDGYELAAELKGRLGEKAPPLVALTGYAQPSDKERALASGFKAHFSKPVEANRLAATIEDLIAAV